MMKVFNSVFLILTIAVPVAAHDYWLEPDNFFIAAGGRTQVRLFVGAGLKKLEERPFQAGKTISFRLFSATGTFDLVRVLDDGALPVLNYSAEKAGTYLLAMDRNWSNIKLEATEFEDYLREEGMDYIIAERAKLGENKKEGRERYSRYIKSLIQVGETRDSVAKNRVGFKLEVVPLENPYAKKVGDDLKLQIFFDGPPLSNKAVFANNRDGDQISTQKLKTDRDGKFTVKLDHKGIWLIRLVYMQRCERNCGEANWESFWTTLSFGVK